MDTTTRARELEAVQQRRAELQHTLEALDRCLSAPALDDPALWAARMRDAVRRLASDFALHVQVTEGPGGLHQAILSGDLRLTNQVAALGAEHAVIADGVAQLQSRARAAVTAADVRELREQGSALLVRLRRHRQRGADLVYEAYHADLGGED